MIFFPVFGDVVCRKWCVQADNPAQALKKAQDYFNKSPGNIKPYLVPYSSEWPGPITAVEEMKFSLEGIALLS